MNGLQLYQNLAGKTVSRKELNCICEKLKTFSTLSGVVAKTRIKDLLKNNPETKHFEIEKITDLPADEMLLGPADPITSLEAYWEFWEHFKDGDVTPAQLKDQFKLFTENEAAIKESLGKMTVKKLRQQLPFSSSSDKKDRLVSSYYDKMLAGFNIKSMAVSYDPFEKGGYKKALEKLVNATTQEDIEAEILKMQKQDEQRKARVAAYKKALENPETIEDYQIFIRAKGREALTDEQSVQYDELVANEGLKDRQKERERKATVSAVDVDTDFKLKETKHGKTGEALWVVEMTNRVDRDQYKELQSKAKRFGGYYSRFVKGFTFRSPEAAQQFMSLQEGDVQKEIEDKSGKKANKFAAMADRLETKARESLNQERKDNTHRRAAMAANAEAQAEKDLKWAKTLRNIGEGFEKGEVKYLADISAASQLEELNRLLYLATYKRERASDKKYEDYDYTPDEAAIKLVEYPYPSYHIETLVSTVEKTEKTKGYVMAANRLRKSITKQYQAYLKGKENTHTVYFKPAGVELLRKFAYPIGKNFDRWDASRIKDPLDRYDRLRKAGITNINELRAALREFMTYKATNVLTEEEQQRKAIVEAERSVKQMKLPGFFPTPTDLAAEMVKIAGIEPGDKVLEPSAGIGHIADAIKAAHPESDLTLIEQASTLVNVLKKKGYKPLHEDFLSHTGKYDKIVMNPPFEDLQDIDHVRHAFSLLNPGGRLVAIMANNKNGERKKVKEFAEWMDEHGYSEPNEEGAFKSAFRPTGVSTITVVLEKGGTKAETKPEKKTEQETQEPKASNHANDTPDKLDNAKGEKKEKETKPELFEIVNDLLLKSGAPEYVIKAGKGKKAPIQWWTNPKPVYMSYKGEKSNVGDAPYAITPKVAADRIYPHGIKNLKNLIFTAEQIHRNWGKSYDIERVQKKYSFTVKVGEIYYRALGKGEFFVCTNITPGTKPNRNYDNIRGVGLKWFTENYNAIKEPSTIEWNFVYPFDYDPKRELAEREEKKGEGQKGEKTPTPVAPSTLETITKKKAKECHAVLLEVKDLHTDTKRFQNRKDAFSEMSARNVAENFDANKFDPVVVWHDKKLKRDFVISGHSRLEGMRRLKADLIPARYFEGTEAEAMKFARVDANRTAHKESFVEDLKAYELLRDGDKSKGIKPVTKTEIAATFPGKANKLEAYSYLNPTGLFIQTLGQDNLSEYPHIETRAMWAGELAKKHPEIWGKLMERNLFYFFYRGDGKGGKLNKKEFFELVQKRIDTLKPSSQVLFPECESDGCKALESAFADKLTGSAKRKLHENQELQRFVLKRLKSNDRTLKVWTKEEAEHIKKNVLEQLKKEEANIRKGIKELEDNQGSLFGTAGNSSKATGQLGDIVDDGKQIVEKAAQVVNHVTERVQAANQVIETGKQVVEQVKELPKTAMPFKSMAELGKSSIEKFNINGAVGAFLGEIERKPVGSVVMTLDAPAGAGKTRFIFQLINQIAQDGYSCLFASKEEHPESALFTDKRDQYISPENLGRIAVVCDELRRGDEFNHLKELAAQFDAIFVDSMGKFPKADLDELRHAVNGKFIVIIYQRTQEGKMRGGSEAEFDGDLICKMALGEDYTQNEAYWSKNRYNAKMNKVRYNVYEQQCYEIVDYTATDGSNQTTRVAVEK